MPYFERKPFANSQEVAGGGPHSPVEVSPLVATSSLKDRSAAILREQSQSLPAWNRNAGISKTGLAGFDAPSLNAVAPVLLNAPPARPGEMSHLILSVINDASSNVGYSFNFTDLVSATGERIPHSAIVCTPKAATVPAGGELEAGVEIEIPTVSPGEYRGLLVCMETVPAILTVIVSA